MEKKRIPVRPHHGMCLAYFIGKGYSEGFSAHMEKMLHILEKDVPEFMKEDSQRALSFEVLDEE